MDFSKIRRKIVDNMYLDFITDIAKIGDTIRITCQDEIIEGTIAKIAPNLIAVRLNDGALVIKKDDEITNLALNPSNIGNNHKSIIEEANEANNSQTSDNLASLDRHSEATDSIDNNEITIGKYEDGWDSIDKSQLKQLINEIKTSLNPQQKKIIVSSNATVREVVRRSFRVNTDKQPKLTVSTATIIETSLMNELMHFSIGDALPVVIYYHNLSELNTVFLTLSPNNIGGYIDILKSAIYEGHYRQAKSLCYFLLSQITKGTARKKILTLVRTLQGINAFIKEKQKSLSSPIKIPKSYKEIEKQLNELIKEGKHDEVIAVINENLENDIIDNKYKSSLLLRKAQTYSSIKDYDHARLTYIDLISFKESTGGDPKNLSHLFTELARLQAIDKSGYDEACKSAEKALQYNAQNKYASTLLEQIKSGNFTTVSVDSQAPSQSLSQETSDEDKELMLDSEDSTLTISKMIDIDIKEHKYSNESIIANGGVPSAIIAENILSEAKSYNGPDLGERYPIYLEAAKAFSELPVGSYDLSNYMEAVAYYAVYKGNFLFKKFDKDIKAINDININYLKRLRDSACSYYVESLNLLTNVNANMLSMILCNYIKLNVAIINIEKKQDVNLSGNFNKVFLTCINSKDQSINEIVWKTIIVVGATSSDAWNRLWSYRSSIKQVEWRLEFNKAIKDSSKRPEIYAIINKQNNSKIDESLSPGSFLKDALSFRQKRTIKLSELLSRIIKEELNLHLLSSLEELWSQLKEFVDLLNETESESKSAVDDIFLIIKPYINRNQVERTNILIQVQSRINEQLTFINDNTTYYGRTFFFPLLRKWRRTIMALLEKKIADTMPQLTVVADPPYIVDVKGTKVVNLIIKNEGESTAEGCVMVQNVTNISSGQSVKARNSYNHEIPSGGIFEVPMNLPTKFSDAISVSLSMSIFALYQGKELEPRVFDFTLEPEPISSLSYEDIPWNDGPIPVEQMFKGRKKTIERLVRHYTSIEKDKPYILYGLTRTGKSSILKYLQLALDKKTVTVGGESYSIATFYWDLSQASSFGNASDMWEYLLFDQLNEYLEEYIGVEGYKELAMPERPRQKELNKTLSYLHKKHIYPMFFVDEFSFIKVMIDHSIVNPAFLQTLRQFSFEGKAAFIYAGTYDVDALLEDQKYGITGQLVGCKKEQVSEIDRDSAKELIQVLGDKLQFTEEAVNHIHRLSGDVPYFVQMICKYCGFYAVENKRAIIGYPELESVIKILTGEKESNESSLVKTLPENVFQNNMFSPADPKEVNVLISSIVYFNRNNIEKARGVSMMELQELWATKKISAFRPKLADSIELLRKKRVLIDDKDEELPVYSLSVDLFRRWWSVHHPDIDLEIDTIM